MNRMIVGLALLSMGWSSFADDNRSNQMNPNNDAYWQSRGHDSRPDDWQYRSGGNSYGGGSISSPGSYSGLHNYDDSDEPLPCSHPLVPALEERCVKIRRELRHPVAIVAGPEDETKEEQQQRLANDEIFSRLVISSPAQNLGWAGLHIGMTIDEYKKAIGVNLFTLTRGGNSLGRIKWRYDPRRAYEYSCYGMVEYTGVTVHVYFADFERGDCYDLSVVKIRRIGLTLSKSEGRLSREEQFSKMKSKLWSLHYSPALNGDLPEKHRYRPVYQHGMTSQGVLLMDGSIQIGFVNELVGI